MWRDSLAVTVKRKKERFVVLTMEVVKRKVLFIASWARIFAHNAQLNLQFSCTGECQQEGKTHDYVIFNF